MTGTGLLDDDRWRDLPPDRKALLRARLALACATAGRGLGQDPTPGALAMRHSRTEVQRNYLLLIDDAMRRVLSGEVKRLLITTPPQVGKSQRVVEWGSFWWLTHRPRARIIALAYADHLAVKRGRNTRKLVRAYGEEYGLVLDPENSAVRDWSTTCGGGMRTAGIGGSITGMPGDLGYVDDPHKNRAEAEVPEQRQKVWDAYSSDLFSRLSPGAPIIVVHTRWHLDDLGGRLVTREGTIQEGGAWLVVHLPAVADPDKYGPDPLGRKTGEPLQHPKIEPEDVDGAAEHWKDKREGSDTRDWYSLYQGDPIPGEGALTSLEMLQSRRHLNPDVERVRVAVSVDPSGGGRDEAGVVGGYLADDGRLYWCADRSGVMPVDDWGRAACLLAYDLKADAIIVEKNFGGTQCEYVIRTSWEALVREGKVTGHKPRIIEVTARDRKRIRAAPVAQQVKEDRVRLAAHMPEVEAEWSTWQQTSTVSPARIDAFTHLTWQLLPPAGSTTTVSSPVKASKQGGSGASAVARRRIDRGSPGGR